jgi:putative (di)nucleoside polyphosphate hydrolase
MIINDNKQILICLSRKFNYWQMPQGGIKTKESIEAAALREAGDEIGCNKLEFIAKIKNYYKYKFKPEDYYLGKYKGQKQSLALLKFIGSPNELNQSPEFTDFKWVNKNDIISFVTPFKQEIIKIGLEKFKDYL